MKLRTGKNQPHSSSTSLPRKSATMVIMALPILVKNSAVFKGIESVEKETDSNGWTIESLKLALKLPFFCWFLEWTVYNWPGKPLSVEKNFRNVQKGLCMWRLKCFPTSTKLLLGLWKFYTSLRADMNYLEKTEKEQRFRKLPVIMVAKSSGKQ